jgi:hypothetical protein
VNLSFTTGPTIQHEVYNISDFTSIRFFFNFLSFFSFFYSPINVRISCQHMICLLPFPFVFLFREETKLVWRSFFWICWLLWKSWFFLNFSHFILSFFHACKKSVQTVMWIVWTNPIHKTVWNFYPNRDFSNNSELHIL